MEIKASLKHLRMSPRKVGLVIDLIRGLKTDKALDQLAFVGKRAAEPVAKLIKSAMANAVNNYGLDKDNLLVKNIRSSAATTLKRWLPRAQGRATELLKRGAHIYITLAEIKDSGKKKAKKQKIEEPVKLEDLAKTKGQAKKNKPEVERDTTKTSEVNTTEDMHEDGRHGHSKIEGKSHTSSFKQNIFRRKSG
ncbi:MAG: 50S ribosomal protein L22 [Planctomycetes bacterium]|jgi:large subunit ribosomal protein L22|nr:50S ribosomal protein L22 [Planctomycetota bacterium]